MSVDEVNQLLNQAQETLGIPAKDLHLEVFQVLHVVARHKTACCLPGN